MTRAAMTSAVTNNALIIYLPPILGAGTPAMIGITVVIVKVKRVLTTGDIRYSMVHNYLPAAARRLNVPGTGS
jgi:hypothetical protein